MTGFFRAPPYGDFSNRAPPLKTCPPNTRGSRPVRRTPASCSPAPRSQVAIDSLTYVGMIPEARIIRSAVSGKVLPERTSVLSKP